MSRLSYCVAVIVCFSIVAGVSVSTHLHWGSSLGLAAAPEGDKKVDGETRPEFAAAGVCARCHVNVVLEWGISEHREVDTTWPSLWP